MLYSIYTTSIQYLLLMMMLITTIKAVRNLYVRRQHCAYLFERQQHYNKCLLVINQHFAYTNKPDCLVYYSHTKPLHTCNIHYPGTYSIQLDIGWQQQQSHSPCNYCLTCDMNQNVCLESNRFLIGPFAIDMNCSQRYSYLLKKLYIIAFYLQQQPATRKILYPFLN